MKLPTTHYALRTKKGFTFIETLVAIAVILTGLVGALVLVENSTRSIRVADDRMVAAHLAQEAVEVVVNIRDTNWLMDQGWRTNLPATTQGIVDYNSTDITETADSNNYCISLIGGLYAHGTPPCNTPFSRHVEVIERSESINGAPVDYIEVRTVVEWQDAGTTRSVTAVHHLYDWR